MPEEIEPTEWKVSEFETVTYVDPGVYEFAQSILDQMKLEGKIAS